MSVTTATPEIVTESAASAVESPPQPTIKEITAQLAKIAAFSGAIKDTETVIRNEVTTRLLEMHDELGTKSVEVRNEDGEVVVTFVVVQPSAEDKIKVSDEDVFLDYVMDHHPGEVETITKVRDSFRTVLLGRLEEVDGTVYDKLTGEPVPGVVHAHTPAGDPTGITTKWTPRVGKQKALAMALADGGVTPLEILA